MFRTKSDCDVCGFEHPTPGDNRAFMWCRKVKGTVCDKCCKKCRYNKEWHCQYDPVGRRRMYELTYANNEDERKIAKLESRLKGTKQRASQEAIVNIINQIKARIKERDKEYESIHSGEVVLTKE